MRKIIEKNQALRRISYFFPFQLLLVHVKKNHLLIVFWLILFGFVTQNLAARYGVPYLFLNPEYRDKSDFLAYLIIGFSCGGFIMAFNITSYIMNGFRFPFLATLSNPFMKYCLNNFIIPGLFLLVYIFEIVTFLMTQPVSWIEILIMVAGFLAGTFIFILGSLAYFFKYNKDIFKMFGVKTQENVVSPKSSRFQRVVMRKNMQWKNLHLTKESRDWHIETYMSTPFKLRLARGFDHYDKEMLIHVFKQNHNNATIFGAAVVVTLLILGLFRETELFLIPAGSSVFLLFTMYLLISSALYTLFRGWAATVLFILFLTFNYVYQFDFFDNNTKAYGLNYDGKVADFSNEKLRSLDTMVSVVKADERRTIEILEKWRKKNTRNTVERQQKPRLILINVSGGGARSALWTLYSLQYADSILGGQLLPHAPLICGSSGGMVGASYLREIYLRYQQKEIKNYYDRKFRNNISKDVLNPIAFSIAINDWFIPFQKFEDRGMIYSKNRAYAFELKLNENTEGVLTKRLKDYSLPEREAMIPMMIYSPTIANDGRKLLISSQPISYLCQNPRDTSLENDHLIDCIEYSRFFSEQDAMETRFTSVLRMNATFPYITPLTELPSEPKIEVMDAGMRDNYGLETSLKFLYTFRNWISSNTSGVVILQIRDKHKEQPIDETPAQTIMQSLSAPLGSFYGNLFNVHDFNQNQLLQYAGQWFNGEIDVIDFELRNQKPDNISLSWHLTDSEKQKVLNSINLPENQEAIRRLKKLLD